MHKLKISINLAWITLCYGNGEWALISSIASPKVKGSIILFLTTFKKRRAIWLFTFVCLVATTTVARGTILVRTVTFGLARRTMRLTPGNETWISRMLKWTATTTTRRTASRFVALRTDSAIWLFDYFSSSLKADQWSWSKSTNK